MAADAILPRPTIFLNPSEPVDLGGNVTIYCQTHFTIFSCYLLKDGNQTSQQLMGAYNPHRSIAKFFISNASWEQTGRYTCCCHNQLFVASECSDPVELLITDHALPRPSISLSPGRIAFLESNITIHCRGKGPIDKFYLHKTDYPSIAQSKEPDGEMAIFPIMKVSQRDGGSYHCSYRPPSAPFNSSKISDDMELFILGPWLSRPTISLSPMRALAPGGHVTVYCRNQYWRPAIKFYLQKPGDQEPQHLMETDGATGKISISNLSLEDAGKYSCSFCPELKPFLISIASDPVELLITDPDWPRPNISLSPGRMAFPGDNITIKCWVKDPIETFYLWKYGNTTKTQSMMAHGNVANFSINNVQLDNRGNYSCSYRPQSAYFRSSKPSISVQVFIFASHLPKPTIYMSPSRRVALGGLVSIKCEIPDGPAEFQDVPAEFFLHKAGDPASQAMRNQWHDGEFSIHNVSWKHQGKYSCSYFFNDRFVFSTRSAPLELLVSDSTQLNIIRLATGSLIFLFLTYIIILDHRYWRENGLSVS
ncbi:immunoglobulin superfamily member 1-like [Eublepharis macularius]|uniref:immunoglobulin superfamily member 1-like n=1 Tax=Eublepharis macularius TaxID=481883 RepID=UPI00240F9926|nr:immunoglobulin superfamily member 1-like [Eublepharis macularius]